MAQRAIVNLAADRADYDPNAPLNAYERAAIYQFFNRERQFMAAEGYVNSQNALQRNRAIQKVLRFSHLRKFPESPKFDAFVPYLAMNYFDCFVSRKEIPHCRDNRREDLDLFAMCCVTLAWKMRKKSFSLISFLAEHNPTIGRKPVMTMEYHILKGLHWRMRSITPLCFLRYFVTFFQAPNGTSICPGFRRWSIIEIIMQIQGDIKFTAYRPSLIAASALLAASSFLYPNDFPGFKQIFLSMEAFTEEPLQKCLDDIRAACLAKKINIQPPRRRRVRDAGEGPSGGTSVGQASDEGPSGGTSEGQASDEGPSSSRQRRPGKETVQEIEDEEVTAEEVTAEEAEMWKEEAEPMNYELKWSELGFDIEEELTDDEKKLRRRGSTLNGALNHFCKCVVL